MRNTLVLFQGSTHHLLFLLAERSEASLWVIPKPRTTADTSLD
jgi:hypothetical protein